MDFLEYVGYESRPFIYVSLGTFSFLNRSMSSVLLISGLVLIACSIAVLYMRYESRLKRVF